ncbi:MAG: PepSY domain-containing protein [Gammaproteobacteria bacterium]
MLLITSVTACSAIEMENEREVAFSEVPEAVLAAARGAVPGITVMEAEMEVEEGRTIYEFEGKVGNRNYEVEVDAEGEVLEIEEIGFFSWL